MGGSLVMPKTSEGNEQLREVFEVRESVWVGLDDKLTEGRFVWADNEALAGWNSWKPGEPNNARYGEDGVIMKSNGQWMDVPEKDSYNYICEVPKSIEVSSCEVEVPGEYSETSTSDTTIPIDAIVTYFCRPGHVMTGGDVHRVCQINGRLSGSPARCVEDPCPECWQCPDPELPCYRRFDEEVSYLTAASRCLGLGGLLAMPRSSSENDMLVSLMSSSDDKVWFGLNDMHTEKLYLWADGEALDEDVWSNWARGWRGKSWSPDGDDCVAMTTTGEWQDQSCVSDKPYICQLPYLEIHEE